MKFTSGKFIFVALATMVLIGVLTYLRVAFKGADVKTAIRLVEEAKISGEPLRKRLEKVLPLANRLCEASFLNRFQGHMEVRCRDAREGSRQLAWQVNVIDGMVRPANEAAIRLGEGKKPWESNQ